VEEEQQAQHGAVGTPGAVTLGLTWALEDQLLVEPSVEILEQVAHQLVVVTHGQDQIQGELVVTHGPVETLEQVEQACLVVVVVVHGQVEIQEQAEDQLLDSLP